MIFQICEQINHKIIYLSINVTSPLKSRQTESIGCPGYRYINVTSLYSIWYSDHVSQFSLSSIQTQLLETPLSGDRPLISHDNWNLHAKEEPSITWHLCQVDFSIPSITYISKPSFIVGHHRYLDFKLYLSFDRASVLKSCAVFKGHLKAGCF